MMLPEYMDMSKLVHSEKMIRLFKAVEENGGTLRFVGGAVRDALAGIKGSDPDLATDLSPDELAEACLDRGIRTIPVGLSRDCTGVVIDDRILKVSSLHHISANGELKYTDDWSADAACRDLTINAVYADLNGNVFDYYNGISDLQNGIVRFIGSAEARIKEDYLRIMRFFRFYSVFAKTPMDKEALAACIKLKDGLRSVPVERVRDELFKLLVTPKVTETMQIIYDNDILGYFLPRSEHLDALWRLARIADDARIKPDFLRRLFVLYQPNSAQAENISAMLRFTKKQKEEFVRWAKIGITAENMAAPAARRKFVYRYGKQFTVDKILVAASIHLPETFNISSVLKEIEDCIVPVFPVRGKDLINRGVTGDGKIGETLKRLEQTWIDSDFSLTRDELLAEI